MKKERPMKLLRIIENRNFEEIKTLLSSPPYNCVINEYKDYFLLKYNQIKSDFSNEAVRQCRGIILDKKTNEVVCRPFDKFFNWGETHAATIEWDSAKVTEKIDGSLIKMWWSDKTDKWMTSTNGTVNAFDAPVQNDLCPYESFGSLFSYVLSLKGFSETTLNKENTYMFELVSPWTKIVIQYASPDIYHIATRNTKEGFYVDENIGIQKPNVYALVSLKDAIQIAETLPFDKEGYVISDANGNRIKVKSPAYVAVHHLKNNGMINRERLLDLVRKGEVVEFVSYFPEFKDDAIKLNKEYEDFMNEIEYSLTQGGGFERVTKVATGEMNRKEFAEWATKSRFPAFFFALLDDKVSSIQEFLKEMPSEKLLKYL